MASVPTRAEISARLALYRTAEAAILSGAQEYEIEDKRFRKADLKELRAEIMRLEGQLAGKDPSVKRMRTQRVLHKRY